MQDRRPSLGERLAEVILQQDRLAFLRECSLGNPPLETGATFNSVHNVYPIGDPVELSFSKAYSNVQFSTPGMLWVKPELFVHVDFGKDGKVFLVDFSISPGTVSGIPRRHNSQWPACILHSRGMQYDASSVMSFTHALGLFTEQYTLERTPNYICLMDC